LEYYKDAKTHWITVVLIGIVWFFPYYFKQFKIRLILENLTFKNTRAYDELEVEEKKGKPEGRAKLQYLINSG